MALTDSWETHRRERRSGLQVLLAPGQETINPIALAKLLYADRLLVLAIVVVSTLAALGMALLATPIYRAEALIAPVASDRGEGLSMLLGQHSGLGSLVEGYIGRGRDETTESIATLRSRALAVEFIREMDLKPQLFPERWDRKRNRWRDATQVPSDLDAYEVFDNQVRHVQIDRRSGLVSLVIEWRDPKAAARWANELVRKVNARRQAEVVNEARRSIEYLQQQAAKTASVEILEVIYRLIQAQTKTITLAKVREEFAFNVIDPAVAPERRIRPNRTALVIVGLGIGLALAIGVVLTRYAFRNARPRLGPIDE
jgi:uncharacterized protein involved in exopolysaccharide biosynthesis